MTDDRLLFLISQPRSGSSLVQQLLLGSGQVASHPESWQMLSLVQTYLDLGIQAGFNPHYAAINFNRHLDLIDQGTDQFRNRIREIALELYAQRNTSDGLYLDKTPRYYHIIEELHRLFPKARFVYLVRNPAAVFTSMLNHNFKGDLRRFLSQPDRVDDLFKAPKAIVRAKELWVQDLSIRYEDLVSDPEGTLAQLTEHLELRKPLSGHYQVDDLFGNSTAVDTKSMHRHDRPVADYLQGWLEGIKSSQQKRCLVEYLQWLEREFEGEYHGYDLAQLQAQAKAIPVGRKQFFTLDLKTMTQQDHKLPTLKLLKKRIVNRIQR